MADNEEKSGWDRIPSLNLSMDEDYSERLKSKESRRHTRADLDSLSQVLNTDTTRLPIRMATATEGTFDGLLLDISESGCRIAVARELRKGELAKVRFVVDDRVVLTKAVVRWISLRNQGCIAGLEFKELPAEQKELLADICNATKLNRVGKLK